MLVLNFDKLMMSCCRESQVGGRVRWHVGYSVSYAHRLQKSSRGSGKRNERNSSYSPRLVGKSHGEDTVLWLEEIKTRARTLQRYTPITRGNLSFFVFIFRALRPCDQDSPISVWKPVYLFRALFLHIWRMVSNRGRFNSVFIRLFERKTHLSGGKST